MIKESSVEVNGHRTNFDHYRNLGYDIQFKKPCKVAIEHLLPGSLLKITSLCDICGSEKQVSFRDYFDSTNGLKDLYYCKKCNSAKRKQTCLEKWGVDNPMKSDVVKQRLRETFIENYGVDHYSKTDEYKQKYKETCFLNWEVDNVFKSDRIKEKIKSTNKQNLGCDFPQQSDLVKNKTTQTFQQRWGQDRYSQTQLFKERIKKSSIEKWGVDNYSKTDEFKSKVIATSLDRWGETHFSKTEIFKKSIRKTREGLTKLKYENLIGDEYEVKSYEGNDFYILHKSCKKEFVINRDNLYHRINLDVCVCTECYPLNYGISNMELEMQEFLNSLGITYIIKDKKVLGGKELDIFLPDFNLAIEMNGIYWHSEIYMDKNYHLEKTEKCRELGINLLHIWEDDWKVKRPIVKSIILNKLGFIKKKVFARKCKIMDVEPSVANKFLDENHIQGYSPSQTKLGLFHEEELVSLMTFGFRHTNGKREFELIRFCNKINYNVIGGASKLFNYFLRTNEEISEIISYSDISLFDGKMYETLGFIHQRTSKPNYFWVVNGQRIHRFNFNKKRLVKLGYDPNKTEVEILHELGYYRVFSCGQEKWIWVK